MPDSPLYFAAHRHRSPFPLDLGGVWYPLRAVSDRPVRSPQTLSYHRGRPTSPKVCRGWVAVPPLVVVMSQLLSVPSASSDVWWVYVVSSVLQVVVSPALECAPVCRQPGVASHLAQQRQGQHQALSLSLFHAAVVAAVVDPLSPGGYLRLTPRFFGYWASLRVAAVFIEHGCHSCSFTARILRAVSVSRGGLRSSHSSSLACRSIAAFGIAHSRWVVLVGTLH